MLNPYRLKELILFDFFYSLSSLKSLVFIIPYFLLWYLIFHNVSNQAVEWLKSTQGLFIASWLLDNQELALQMFVDRSATLSIYLLFSISIMPLFVMLAANNQYSSDASSGAFRFILTRATRMELFLSRFVAVVLLVTCCIFITTLWASVQAYMNGEDDLHSIMIFGSQTLLILVFYSLPFIAFMSMISAFAKSAFGSLFMGIMFYILMVIFVFWLRSDISYAIYLIPSGIKPALYNINTENILTSITLLTCYALFYFACGWNVFRHRDM